MQKQINVLSVYLIIALEMVMLMYDCEDLMKLREGLLQLRESCVVDAHVDEQLAQATLENMSDGDVNNNICEFIDVSCVAMKSNDIVMRLTIQIEMLTCLLGIPDTEQELSMTDFFNLIIKSVTRVKVSE